MAIRELSGKYFTFYNSPSCPVLPNLVPRSDLKNSVSGVALKRTADQSLGLDQNDAPDCSLLGKKIMIVETKVGHLVFIGLIFTVSFDSCIDFSLAAGNLTLKINEHKIYSNKHSEKNAISHL